MAQTAERLRGAESSYDDVFQKQIVEVDALHEVARKKAHVVEFCKVEDMRFQQDGRGNVHLVADVEKVVQKMRIGELFFVFVYQLPLDFSVFYRLCPNFRQSLRLLSVFA